VARPRNPTPKVDRLIIADADADVAWLLVDAAGSCVTGHERTIVFVELGCGETYLAIERILTAVMSSRMVLQATTHATLTGWLHGYSPSPAEPRLAGCLLRFARCDSKRFRCMPKRRSVAVARAFKMAISSGSLQTERRRSHRPRLDLTGRCLVDNAIDEINDEQLVHRLPS
jgi:hypothetical protein